MLPILYSSLIVEWLCIGTKLFCLSYLHRLQLNSFSSTYSFRHIPSNRLLCNDENGKAVPFVIHCSYTTRNLLIDTDTYYECSLQSFPVLSRRKWFKYCYQGLLFFVLYITSGICSMAIWWRANKVLTFFGYQLFINILNNKYCVDKKLHLLCLM